MYELYYDSNKNRIYVVLKGFMNIDEVKYYVKALKCEIDKATIGFTTLFDNRNLEILPEECIEIVRSVKEYAASKGLAKSAIVVKNAIQKMYAKRFFGNIAIGRPEVCFSTFEEAEVFLDT